MKRILKIVFGLLLAILSAFYGNKQRTYATTMVVTEVDYEQSIVCAVDAVGFKWSFVGDDYYVGDIVSCTMLDPGTPNDISDDEIVSAIYSGTITMYLESMANYESE